MADFRRSTSLAAVAVTLSLVLGLAGCGRKGPLELPPSSTPSPQADVNQTQPSFGPSSMLPGSQQQTSNAQIPNSYDTHGNPVYQPPSKNKSFILDPILQ